ncbi:MAG: hypothetical protein AB1705_05435 [Verrucomicrobiota bacterium]
MTQRYCCPHCLTVHVKDPATQMLSANPDEVVRGAYHLDAVERMETIRCRCCQQPIDYKRLLAGAYDYHGWGLNCGIVAGVVALGVLRWIFGLGWAGATLAAVVAGIVVGLVFDKWERARIRDTNR